MPVTRDRAIQVLRKLRAVRRFADRPIPDDVMRDILEVGRRTGSSKNTQPWELVVVRDREMLKRLSELGGFAGYVAGAQVDIVLVMDSANNAFDCGRLAERLMLAAWAHGVGSCIASLFPDDNARRAKELLDIPAARGSGRRWPSAIPRTRRRRGCPARRVWPGSFRSAGSTSRSSSAGSATAADARAGPARSRSTTPDARALRRAKGPVRVRCTPRPSAEASERAGAR